MLNYAQTLLLSLFATDPPMFPAQSKSPHAYTGTPQKPKYKRQRTLRLFKGHRM